MGVVARKGLVQALRTRVSDDRASVTAFSISVTGDCKGALLEVTNGYFTVTVEGGNSVKSIRFNLNDAKYSTIGKLIREVSRKSGYKCVEDAKHKADSGFPSISLKVETGITEISNGESHTLRHHIFSDEELRGYLSEAITLHNPNYRINTVPAAEHAYVLMKAQARCYRTLASDSARRRGLDTDATVFIDLAKDLEAQYKEDSRRQHRILPSAKIDESKVGTGDLIQGTLSRKSLRQGYTSPYRAKITLETPVLLDPADDDIEDVTVRLRWNQDRDPSFSYYELWRDTQPNVERSVSGRLGSQQLPASGALPFLPTNTQFSRASTSLQIMGLAAGGNRLAPTFDGFFFWTSAALAGSNIVNVSFIDGVVAPSQGASSIIAHGEPLEPEQDYFYRLYGIDHNGEIQHSNVLRVTTKNVRGKFARLSNNDLDPASISPTSGVIAGGTALTITGTNFDEGIYLTIAGKRAVEGSRSSTVLVVTTPGLINADSTDVPQDLVLVSPNGLRDIVKQGFTYT